MIKNSNNELYKLISLTLKIDLNLINSNTKAVDFDNWDSLANVRLILAIEKKFNIKIDYGEALSVDDVGDLSKLIEEKLK